MIIYLITQKSTELQYVGKTSRSLEKRWKEHCNPPKGRETYLTNSVQKYGSDDFTVEILETCATSEELSDRERHWIHRLNTVRPNGFNLTDDSAGGLLAESTRQKMVDRWKDGKHPWLNRKHTEESRRKMKEYMSSEKHPWRGRKKSEESKAKVSAALKGRVKSKEHINKLRVKKRRGAVIAINQETGELHFFACMGIARKRGYNYPGIYRALTRGTPYKNLIWQHFSFDEELNDASQR